MTTKGDCPVCALVNRALKETETRHSIVSVQDPILLNALQYRRALTGVLALYERYPAVFHSQLCVECENTFQFMKKGRSF